MVYYPIFALYSAPVSRARLVQVWLEQMQPSERIGLGSGEASQVFDSRQSALQAAEKMLHEDSSFQGWSSLNNCQIDLQLAEPNLVELNVWEPDDDQGLITSEGLKAYQTRTQRICQALLHLQPTLLFGSVFADNYAGEPDHYAYVHELSQRLDQPELKNYLQSNLHYFWFLGGPDWLKQLVDTNFTLRYQYQGQVLYEQTEDLKPGFLDV